MIITRWTYYRSTDQKHAKVCKRHKARTHMYLVNHTPSRSRNWCGFILDSPKAFWARILIGLNTMDSWIRCECTKLTRGIAKAARTRETPDFLGRPASQTSEVQDGSRQPAINFKNLDQKPSVSLYIAQISIGLVYNNCLIRVCIYGLVYWSFNTLIN